MKNVLIVIDMQKDFIDGSLGSPEAQAIVPKVAEKIAQYRAEGKRIIFTADTHSTQYLKNTLEGKYLPIEHCQYGTKGWELHEAMDYDTYDAILKETFGYMHWTNLLYPQDMPNGIEICGLCTDICVVSNALILRATFPNTKITCNASCCAGTTPERHKAALDVMRSCQIDVVNDY